MTAHVVVLAGGLTHEREVSLRSGSRLHEALRAQGLDVTLRDTDAELMPGWPRPSRTRRSSPCTAVAARTARCKAFSRWPGCRTWGPRRTTAGWPGTRTSPRTWCSAPVSHAPVDVTVAQHIPRPRRADVDRSAGQSPGLAADGQAAARRICAGRRRRCEPRRMPSALVNAFAYGDIVMVEQFVDGIELAITVIEDGRRPAGPARGRDRPRPAASSTTSPATPPD